MTPIDYAALAERLKEHAALHDSLAAHSDEQRVWADDLRTVVTLLRGMAHREAVQYAHADGCWTWGPRHYECALREIDRLHSAPQPTPGDWLLVPKEPTPEMLRAVDDEDDKYLARGRAYLAYQAMLASAPHPAPQPQPAQPPKCGCRSCLTPAELLSTFVVCPKCGNKRCPKADDHRNACTDSNAPGQAPQPERQPVSEPIEAQCMGCGKSYSDFALDLTLPADQWRAIHPEGDGLLCANCIVARAAKVPGAVAVRAQIDTGEQREPTEAQIEAAATVLFHEHGPGDDPLATAKKMLRAALAAKEKS